MGWVDDCRVSDCMDIRPPDCIDTNTHCTVFLCGVMRCCGMSSFIVIQLDFKCQGGDPSVLGTAKNPTGTFHEWMQTVLKKPARIHRPSAMRLNPISGMHACSFFVWEGGG